MNNQPRSLKELRNQYQVSHQTFKKWIKTIPDLLLPGQKKLNSITPDQYKKIITHLGEP